MTPQMHEILYTFTLQKVTFCINCCVRIVNDEMRQHRGHARGSGAHAVGQEDYAWIYRAIYILHGRNE